MPSCRPTRRCRQGSATRLRALFDLAYHTKHVDTIFARVFGSETASGTWAGPARPARLLPQPGLPRLRHEDERGRHPDRARLVADAHHWQSRWERHLSTAGASSRTTGSTRRTLGGTADRGRSRRHPAARTLSRIASASPSSPTPRRSLPRGSSPARSSSHRPMSRTPARGRNQRAYTLKHDARPLRAAARRAQCHTDGPRCLRQRPLLQHGPRPPARRALGITPDRGRRGRAHQRRPATGLGRKIGCASAGS